MTQATPNPQTSPQTPQPNPPLLRLEAFVGEWQWKAAVGGQPIGHGWTVFKWLEGSAFTVSLQSNITEILWETSF
jgi:hypothetical protein